MSRPPISQSYTSPSSAGEPAILYSKTRYNHHSPPSQVSSDVSPSKALNMPRRLKRGMTYAEAHDQGILSSRSRSKEFVGIPLEEKEINKLPKRVRKYYRHLATLHQHYLEVDSVLSGELPGTIASSFAPSANSKQKDYSRLAQDFAQGDEDGRPEWARRESAWRMARPSHNALVGEAGSGEVDEMSPLTGTEREKKREKLARLALNVNTLVNFLLTAAKLVAVLFSSSISLTASLVDSALDLLSTMIIFATSWAIGLKADRHLYPAGKRRFEPLGVLIFSVIMIASFVQVFIESFQRATRPADREAVDLSWIGIGTMLATIVIKSFLWVWCSRIPSSGVQALAQDAENDVWLNSMALAFPYIGSKLHLRLFDPIGGMILSSYIIFEWIKTLLENFGNLSGKSATPDQISRVLYLVTRFNPVLEIGDIECYHMGDDLIVEIEVILPKSSTLHFAHDVGETIQCVIESLDGVLRAYVHCDYSSSNPLQHTARNHSNTNGHISNNSPLPELSEHSSGTPTPTNERPYFTDRRATQDQVPQCLSPGAVEGLLAKDNKLNDNAIASN